MDTFIELLRQEIRRTGCDPRAETIIALAMDMGLAPEDYLIACDNLFGREYHKDVAYPEVKEDARMKYQLLLHLSRGGVYDQLPEGLFFQPEGKGRGQAAGDMAADHKRNKKREEDIRRFFQPLENEMFAQRVALEKEEVWLLEGMQSGMLDDYFMRFWNIPSGIPRAFIAPLLLLLPFAYRIAGDLPLMASALEQLLKEPVTTRKTSPSVASVLPMDTPGLGEATLGLDMVCQGAFVEDLAGVEWVIGPLQTSHPTDYLEGGNRFVLMETFSRFFVPAGMDTRLDILVDAASSDMVLGSDEGAVLGYSCMLTS